MAQLGLEGPLQARHSVTTYSFETIGSAAALAIANQHIAGPGAVYVAAQVGADVIVFADTDGDRSNGADIAVVLAGTHLDEISLANFV